KDLLSSASSSALRYLEQVSARSVFPTNEALDNLKRLGGPLTEHGEDPLAVLKLLDDYGSPATVATTGGRYFGFVIGGSLPATVAANWLPPAWDQDAGLSVMAPSAVYVEEIALGWLLELLNLPPQAAGAFVTGAQMANFAGLAAARHAVLRRAGWDAE